jgi:RNA polymerase sigma factor (sigma-70 family)
MEEQHESHRERDLLRMFTNDVRKFNVLTREEENNLLLRLKEGKPEMMNRLIEANLRFALKVVFLYWRPGYPLMNMISGACLGLVVAGKTFNPDIGVRFITYAFPAIVQQVRKAMFEGDLEFCESLDAPIFEDGDCLKDRIVSDEDTPEEKAEAKELIEYLAILTPRERRVIDLRFWADKTLDDVGLTMGIQRERVRQIENRAIVKLRFALKGM